MKEKMKGMKRIREMFEKTKRINRKEREMMKEEIDHFVRRKENEEITEWIEKNEMKEMTEEIKKRYGKKKWRLEKMRRSESMGKDQQRQQREL